MAAWENHTWPPRLRGNPHGNTFSGSQFSGPDILSDLSHPFEDPEFTTELLKNPRHNVPEARWRIYTEICVGTSSWVVCFCKPQKHMRHAIVVVSMHQQHTQHAILLCFDVCEVCVCFHRHRFYRFEHSCGHHGDPCSCTTITHMHIHIYIYI